MLGNCFRLNFIPEFLWKLVLFLVTKLFRVWNVTGDSTGYGPAVVG